MDMDKEELFGKINDLNVNELKELRKERINTCLLKSNKQNLDDNEASNDGYLFFNCKMIIEYIRLIDSKMINKFNDELSSEDQHYFQQELDYLDAQSNQYNNMEDVKKVLDKIK